MSKATISATTIEERLANFDGSKAGKYDPGSIIILFDARNISTSKSQLGYIQSTWTSTLYNLGWPSFFTPTDLDPGFLRLIWLTHAGNQGQRDWPLYRANAVKEMFDSLSEEGFRPMVLGWSAENPYPMIGGSEPPKKPQKPKVRVATTWSNTVSGHGEGSQTPFDRVMAIINEEERREAERRKQEVEGTDEKGIKLDSAV